MFYEPGDRMITAIVNPVADALQAFNAEVQLDIQEHGIECLGERLRAEDLSTHLLRRGVHTIGFQAGTPSTDIWSLLVLLATSIADIKDAGGVPRCLAKLGAHTILVNEQRVLDAIPDDPEFDDPPWVARVQRRRSTQISKE